MSVGIMASVRGTLIFNRVPSPSFESISTVPLSWAILVFTTSMPTPRPETSEISFLVEKPGAKIKPKASVSDSRSALSARSEEHTSELQSRGHLVCRLLLEKKNKTHTYKVQ